MKNSFSVSMNGMFHVSTDEWENTASSCKVEVKHPMGASTLLMKTLNAVVRKRKEHIHILSQKIYFLYLFNFIIHFNIYILPLMYLCKHQYWTPEITSHTHNEISSCWNHGNTDRNNTHHLFQTWIQWNGIQRSKHQSWPRLEGAGR